MGVPWPPGLRELILERDGSCRRCGAVDELEVDHVVARWLGGLTVESNLQVLCRPCNLAKRHEDGWGVRPPRPLPPIRHGTLYAYRRRKCRCPDCRAASAAHRRRMRHQAAARA